MKKKYTIKKHGKMFKIYELATKQFIIQCKYRKPLTKLLGNLNKGGFFNGDTPKFMLLGGPITIDGQRNNKNT